MSNQNEKSSCAGTRGRSEIISYTVLKSLTTLKNIDIQYYAQKTLVFYTKFHTKINITRFIYCELRTTASDLSTQKSELKGVFSSLGFTYPTTGQQCQHNLSLIHDLLLIHCWWSLLGSQIVPQRLILRNAGDMSVSDVCKTVDGTPQSAENINYDS